MPQRVRVESAQAVGVPVIAFANKPGKSQTLPGTNPHPDGIVIDLVEPTDAAPRAYAQTER